MSKFISGGYSVGVPPLPIPNREVKPVRADGTASSGRVGRRPFSERFFKVLKDLFFCVKSPSDAVGSILPIGIFI